MKKAVEYVNIPSLTALANEAFGSTQYLYPIGSRKDFPSSMIVDKAYPELLHTMNEDDKIRMKKLQDAVRKVNQGSEKAGDDHRYVIN